MFFQEALFLNVEYFNAAPFPYSAYYDAKVTDMLVVEAQHFMKTTSRVG